MSNSSGSTGGGDEFRVVSSTAGTKKKKGPVLMKNLIKKHQSERTKITVSFDSMSRPIGNDATIWRSYLGSLARSRVPITFGDWRKVPAEYKESLWAEASDIFEGIGPYKKFELKVAGTMWKHFKTRLANEYIFGPKSDEDPVLKYTFLDSESWNQFKEERLSEVGQNKRQSSKELCKKNLYAHTLGRGGYIKLEQKLAAAKVAESQARGEEICDESASNVISHERHELWKLGRMRGQEFVTEGSARVGRAIDELVERSTQGQWSSQDPRHDILTEAIGTPEPRGRTRGVGAHIPWTVGLSKSSSSSSSAKSRPYRREASEAFSRHCPSEVDMWTNIPKTGLKSLLLIDGQLDGETKLVGLGIVHEFRFLNYRPILQDEVVVRVEHVCYDGQGAALPRPDPKIRGVQAALHNYVAWPKHLVQVDRKVS